MDDHARPLKHFGSLPTLPTLEEAQARLVAGLPPNFARFAADLLAHPGLNELVVGRGISVQGIVQDAERLVVEGTVEATMIHAAELSITQGGGSAARSRTPRSPAPSTARSPRAATS